MTHPLTLTRLLTWQRADGLVTRRGRVVLYLTNRADPARILPFTLDMDNADALGRQLLWAVHTRAWS